MESGVIFVNPVVVSGRVIYLVDTSEDFLCIDNENGKLLWAQIQAPMTPQQHFRKNKK